MTEQCDVVIVGAGVAGLSVAWRLASRRRVVVLERESQPGYHTSGRSAAQFAQTFEPPAMRRLAVASRDFFEHPPDGFADHPIAAPRSSLVLARPGQEAALRAELDACAALGIVARLVDEAEARRLFPPLVPGLFSAGLDDPEAKDLDVDLILQGYLKGMRAGGARLATDAEVTGLERRGGLWHAVTRAGDFAAPIVVDAAGAWADQVARLAGVAPLGLVPKRRTALVFYPPAGADTSSWAHTGDLDETWYVKPQPGQFMASLSDAAPSPPCDAQPEEIDIAQAIFNVEQATSLRIARPRRTWAGLRSFLPDEQAAVGFAPETEGFFWLAGQGGVGILTSPALSRAAASLIETGELPADLRALGLAAGDLAPARFAPA